MKDLAQELMLLEKQLEHVAHETLKDAGEMAVEEARHTTLFHHGSHFEGQIQFHPHGIYQGEVVSGAEYSQYLEYGNDPGGGIIHPTQAKSLHFNVNGEEVFAKHVKAHEPYPFMDQAADKVEEELAQLWAHQFDKHIK